MDERCQQAWGAGLFDGEGWVGRTARGVQARINQAGADGIPEVLVRFQRAVGCGRVRGPDLVAGRLPLYRWEATSRADVERVRAAIAPWLGPVKAEQFARALGRAVSAALPVSDAPEWRAWAAGLWDGEGCVSVAAHRTHAGHHIIEAALTQQGTADGCALLGRFAQVVGCGRVYGPYAQASSTAPVFRWKAYGLDRVTRALHVLLPWLARAKSQQARRAVRLVGAEPPLQRGNPAWGHHKTHCLRGHEYATARARPYRARSEAGAVRRASEQCMRCVRERAKWVRARAERGDA